MQTSPGRGVEEHLGAGGRGVAAGLLQQLHEQLIPQLRPLYTLYRQPSPFLPCRPDPSLMKLMRACVTMAVLTMK